MSYSYASQTAPPDQSKSPRSAIKPNDSEDESLADLLENSKKAGNTSAV